MISLPVYGGIPVVRTFNSYYCSIIKYPLANICYLQRGILLCDIVIIIHFATEVFAMFVSNRLRHILDK